MSNIAGFYYFLSNCWANYTQVLPKTITFVACNVNIVGFFIPYQKPTKRYHIRTLSITFQKSNMQQIATAQRLQTVEEYYFSIKLAQIRQMNEAGKAVINLGIGSPDLPPHPSVIAALHQTAQQSNTHGYQSYTGIPALRQAMAAWYRRIYGVELSPDKEILPLMGSKEGIVHISLAYLNPDDTVLVPNPGYPTYTSASQLCQANIVSYPLLAEQQWQPDWAYLEQIDLSRAKIMWVNYPNMPTGANANLQLFEKLVAFAHQHQLLLVNDNPYSQILNPSPMSIFQVDGAKEVALELNSLSKSYNMAGWRVGMLCGNATALQNVLKVKSNMDSGMFLGIQQAAIQALQLPQTWQEQQDKIYTERRQKAYQIVATLGCSHDPQQTGMFVWAKLPDSITNATQFVDHILEQAHVFITPGSIFGSEGSRYIRLSLCSTAETFETALQRIQQLL